MRASAMCSVLLFGTFAWVGCAGSMAPDDGGARRDGMGVLEASADRSSPVDAALDGSNDLDAAPSIDAVDPGDTTTMTDAGGSDVITRDVAPPRDVAPTPCRTRITYGNAWIHDAAHTAMYDDADGAITWDGVCGSDGTNSFATLSNGWRPYFSGRNACVLALDYSGSCSGVPTACETRVTYASTWLNAPGHAAQYDDAAGVVSWNNECSASGAQSSATLSNGWQPYFSGTNGCGFSFRYTQCGGLYDNAVVATDCPDPGVVRDGNMYVMACTGGGYAIRTSPDLVHWTRRGFIFPSGSAPTWATGDFWAPEIHHVGNHWVAYFSARYRANNRLAIGAASGPTSTGPFTDIGHPLINDPNPGVIDVSEYTAPDGTPYLLWKTDGNAVGASTPIHIQRLAADGLSLVGSPRTILTNDRAWEGSLVEGPWMIDNGGMYYLFYSANGYASTRYAIGVARATSPLGPFTKAPNPIVTSNGVWAGPGHGSVVRAPDGGWVQVYHAWQAAHVGTAPGRFVLLDRITWSNGWPQMLGAPSSRSLPPP